MNKLAIVALAPLFILPAAAAETGAEDAAQGQSAFGANTLLFTGQSRSGVLAG